MRENTVVRGIKDVLKTIQKIQAKSGQAMPDIEEKAALELELEAATTVQVEHGRLKGSIQTYKTTDGYEVSAGGTEDSGVEVDYAGHIEFGTKNARAYPFMRPAAAKVQEKYPELAISGINDSFRKAGVK